MNQIVHLNTVNHITCTWTITSLKSCYLPGFLNKISKFWSIFINITYSSIYVEFCNVCTKFWSSKCLKHIVQSLNLIVLSRILQVSIESSFLLLEIFLKNFNQGQYGLIHIVHLVNFDQSLSTLHMVRSVVNFAMFLANSNQETIWTIWVKPYCPY